MSEIIFQTIEEAVVAFKKKLEEIESLKNENKASKERIAKLEKDLSDTEEIAKDAIAKYNEQPNHSDVTVTVEKKKYKVLFGVDGLSKDELSVDNSKLKELVKGGSQALELVEG